MAKLINGDGNTAVYASEDADLIASLAGNVTGIAKLGNQFAYELADANTIEVKDGVIITQEGRRIQLDVNAVDIFEIPNGVQGNTNYYIIGYKLETDAESKQTATTFVQLMDNGTDTIPEGTFRGGDTDVYISLYRVTQDGLSITDVDLLLPVLDNISELKSALTEDGVSITPLATDTWAQVLTALETAIDWSKITSKSKIIFGSRYVYNINDMGTYKEFTNMRITSSIPSISTISLASHTYYLYNGSTVTNYSNNASGFTQVDVIY